MAELFDGLTENEILFVYEFLKERNRTQAAINCGRDPKWASSWGSAMYRKPRVRAAIDQAMGIICEEIKIDAKWVLEQYVVLYNIDLEEIITLDSRGEPQYDFTNASPELMQAIESIDISPSKYGTKIKVTLPSKQKLLADIGKHIDVNAFKEVLEHTGAVNVIFDDQDKEA